MSLSLGQHSILRDLEFSRIYLCSFILFIEYYKNGASEFYPSNNEHLFVYVNPLDLDIFMKGGGGSRLSLPIAIVSLILTQFVKHLPKQLPGPGQQDNDSARAASGLHAPRREVRDLLPLADTLYSFNYLLMLDFDGEPEYVIMISRMQVRGVRHRVHQRTRHRAVFPVHAFFSREYAPHACPPLFTTYTMP